ncbi:MAG: hypothetical protein AB1772_09525 [Candidatus Zixiibacteriota bacterium]
MTKVLTMILALAALGLAGCDEDDNIVTPVDRVPATPQGVYSITGNSSVLVIWNGIYEKDVDYYRVYRSLQATTGYVAIANVDAVPNPNLDLLIYEYRDFGATNGVTYWYAVTAVDNAGQESPLSAENVFDTPRPEDIGTMQPNDLAPNLAGFNLATHANVAWDSEVADVYVDRADGIVYLNAGVFTPNQTDIQDLGYTAEFDDVGWAPEFGWSELGYYEAIVGHTYIIWTSDNHYAKIRITSITPSGTVGFQWAWQSVEGNLELAPPVRPVHDDQWGQPKASTKTSELLK